MTKERLAISPVDVNAPEEVFSIQTSASDEGLNLRTPGVHFNLSRQVLASSVTEKDSRGETIFYLMYYTYNLHQMRLYTSLMTDTYATILQKQSNQRGAVKYLFR
jgi:hypothetical protein